MKIYNNKFMSNNKQSSIEKMFQEMLGIQQEGIKLTFDENLALLEKYKAMHKEEVLNFDSLLDKHQINAYKNNTIYLSREEFYNETFGE